MKIPVIRKILEVNDQMAEDLRSLFKENKILTVNMMSSPGAGKTAILEQTLNSLKDEMNMAVFEGDIQTSNDAQRISATGAQALQINTDGACHLDSSMILEATKHMQLESVDVLFIENVGNLVCPAEFDLGEDYRIALLSLPEGDDKPEKYPKMFMQADVLLINKIDLLPYLDFDIERVKKAAMAINNNLTVFTVSARTGEGLDKWYNWLLKASAARKEQLKSLESVK